MLRISLTYLILLVIVYLSFYGVGSFVPGNWNLILMSALKFLFISFVFMNLLRAHFFWKLIFSTVIVVYSFGIWFLA
ncbi:prokaryotic cytochrome C oxidase subunit IV [Leptospira kemamanensis]|uniref:Prokaryotic cytochrome C oxidase subunit IV n=1 Tax=Leptospira kemamanensis TaxID=2484942 RepID=A0A4R9JN50_9LEPT|nr:prokaryotic cytochrome C oxidase subunit IV [Leptospira kemamanensis]TGL51384.1 prokaryotic cytochrome C oxidase subunit IV [Leptospira kemamanensis]